MGNMEMGFKFQMGMGMKSLKWEGIGTKNLSPHTSTSEPPREYLLQQSSGHERYKPVLFNVALH